MWIWPEHLEFKSSFRSKIKYIKKKRLINMSEGYCERLQTNDKEMPA